MPAAALPHLCLGPEASTRKAVAILDANHEQIALVVDRGGVLLGTITDADVRRAMLAGVAPEDPVAGVMNKSPTVASAALDRRAALAILRRSRHRHLPLVDDAGRLCDIVCTVERIPEPHGSSALIMAGGLGRRLRPLTDDVPKPLLRVGHKPLLERIIEGFVEAGFRRVFLAVNYRAEMVQEYFGDGSSLGVRIDYLHEERPLGTAGALALLPRSLCDPLVVMNGDLLTKLDFRQLLDFHRQHGASATMCVREHDVQIPYGVVCIDGHRLEGIDEKPVHRMFVNAGIYVLSPAAVASVSPGEACSMPALFDKLLADGERPGVFPIHEYWIDIGHATDYERANSDCERLFPRAVGE
ncbi:MAG: nucleotidyltransferase family protein [Myxococcales bacterium]|nr:nucleotidyltransferase family protein [Myxococcales bacterium]